VNIHSLTNLKVLAHKWCKERKAGIHPLKTSIKILLELETAILRSFHYLYLLTMEIAYSHCPVDNYEFSKIFHSLKIDVLL
jgi:hypothetical protein